MTKLQRYRATKQQSYKATKRHCCIVSLLHCCGFTLIELLVVMTILGLLSTVGLVSFRTSQMKSRDSQRKSDLGQIQRALELYYNDYNAYPSSTEGKINVGGALNWGDEFKDAKGTVYMKELPKDPTGNPEYCYMNFTSPVSYKIYAKLENSKDPKIGGPYTCAGTSYNYGVASSNTTP